MVSQSVASPQVTSRYTKTADPAVLNTPEGATVTLVKGVIADQQVMSMVANIALFHVLQLLSVISLFLILQ